MLRWTGFADLSFAESARLSLARAVEQAETEAHEELPGAWVIEDRRITFSVETETSRATVEGLKRLFGALMMVATSGEVMIEVEGGERWARKASSPSVSKEIAVGEERDLAGETIRTQAS